MPTTPVAPFVAREPELDLLAAAVDDAGRGVPSLLLVGGDAGVGKTRLLGRAAERARDRGAAVVESHCVDLGAVGLPYLPFVEALALLRGQCEIVEEVAQQRPALARLLDADASAAPDDRLQLFDGLATVLARAGSPGAPLVLLVEDLHWADPSTLDVLRFLVARMRDEHLAVIATFRSDDLHRRHPLRPVLAELGRHPRVSRIDLAPFSAAELRVFTTAVAGRPLPPAAFETVRERSEGNAYFAEELVASGVARGELPWSLAEALQSRVDALDPASQRVVRAASADGRVVQERLLRAVLETGVLPLTGTAGASAGGGSGTADAALRETVAQQVLRTEPDGRLGFHHALLAEAVYADLLPGEQVAVHRAYLEAMAADPTLGSAAQRASHAARAHDLPTTLVAAHQAALEARRLLAPTEELRHLEQVLELWDGVPDPAGLVGRGRSDVALDAASAAERSGDPQRAVALARAAVDAVPDELERAALQHVVAGYLLAVEDGPAALRRTEEALAVLPVDPPSRARAATLAAHARAALNGDLDEVGRRSATEAVAVAQAVDAPAIEANALNTLAILSVDEPEDAAELVREARDRALAAGDVDTAVRAWWNLGATWYYGGRLDDARAALDEAADYARRTGRTWSAYGTEIQFFRELTAYVLGDLHAAPDDRVPAPSSVVFRAVRLYSAVARGDEDVVERALALRPEWHVDTSAALIAGGCAVDALTLAGRTGEAVEIASEVVAYLSAEWTDVFLGQIWISALALAALADEAEREALLGRDVGPLVARGETFCDAATRSAERGRPRGGRLGPEARGWLARVRAEHARLAAAAGGPPVDPRAWATVVEEFGYGYRYEVARSRFRWAEALVVSGDRDAGARELTVAVDEADAMGARPLADACRALARRARLDVGGVRAPTAGVLTDREAEVLGLVARGLSNRQVGEVLFISGKTVSVHVSNVLAKLGAGTRTEAVTLAHERGLLDLTR
ncbi:ATP-binding protein [Luteimicrobium subarcticum]|uniref:Regulatory LuxR family protein n=1 Tax=Luteimicrobium subarcticum TaxID=620910 RepID=A0A2M8WJ84_9MICO|nr:helix-turn-helix transcriptional regulator [Luteimicrobium subarcticum]PJI90997.1 regulatory LuxR family protein [Luteimicrobium subarcticum]